MDLVEIGKKIIEEHYSNKVIISNLRVTLFVITQKQSPSHVIMLNTIMLNVTNHGTKLYLLMKSNSINNADIALQYCVLNWGLGLRSSPADSEIGPALP